MVKRSRCTGARGHQEKVLGPEHRTCTGLNNFAALYRYAISTLIGSGCCDARWHPGENARDGSCRDGVRSQSGGPLRLENDLRMRSRYPARAGHQEKALGPRSIPTWPRP